MNRSLNRSLNRSPSRLPSRSTPLAGLALAAALAAVIAPPIAAAQPAGTTVYGLVGTTGLGLGIAQSIAPAFGLRADVSGLPRISRSYTEEQTRYDGDLAVARIGLYADWHPWEGRFRTTAGLTFATLKLDLQASGAGRTVSLNGRDYTLGPDDRLRGQLAYPGTLPYLGIGWGYAPRASAGWGLNADIGLGFGKVKAELKAEGPWTTAQPGLAADLDRELQKLRDDAGKVRVYPMVSTSVSYRF